MGSSPEVLVSGDGRISSTVEDDAVKTTEPSLQASEDPESRIALRESVKKWRRVVLYCVGMSSAILMYGYDYAIIGTTAAMPGFQ